MAADESVPIGAWGPWIEAPDPVEAGERRRFLHASLDDTDTAERGDTLPALYPLHAERRALDAPDPFDRLDAEPDWDGADLGWESAGLAPLAVARDRDRAINAGSKVTLHRLARLGDRIRRRSAYVSVDEREGRSGPMTRVVVRTEYADGDGELLLVIDNTVILR